MHRKWIGRMFWIATGALIVLTIKAHAFDKPEYANSPHQEWFATQKNSNGQVCCSTSDAFRYDGDYTLNADGSATLKLDTGDVKIEARKVLTTPNPIGVPLWWHIGTTTYCFLPGAGI